jgi:hypothetical protein
MLNIYRYHTNPEKLLYHDSELYIGDYNGKKLFISSVEYEKKLNILDGIEYCKSLNMGTMNGEFQQRMNYCLSMSIPRV